MRVAVVKAKRNGRNGEWLSTLSAIESSGITVHNSKVDADVFVVLSGTFENPGAFQGKRILFYKEQEWYPAEQGAGFKHFYQPLLKAYYHEFVDCSKDKPADTVKRVKAIIDAA